MNSTTPKSSSLNAGAPKNVVWSVFKNTSVQVVGRLLGTLSKYIAYILIFRYFGVERFGEYAIILTLVTFGEALLDFGYGEICVREMSQAPGKSHQALSVLTYSKIFQLALSYLLLVSLLIILQYSTEIIISGMIAGIGFVWMAGCLVYRSMFKTMLEMERDVIAELSGAAVFIIALIVICILGSGLITLCVALALSRFTYFIIAYLQGRAHFTFRHLDWDSAAMRRYFFEALPVGLSVAAVAVYTSVDVLMLSKLDTALEVGLYAAAYRFVLPLVSVAAALMGALYPILSAYWGDGKKEQMLNLYRQGVDCSMLIAGAVFCGVQATAGFMMGLFGQDAMDAVPILRVLSWGIALMFLSCIVGPLFVAIGRQWLTFVLGSCGVILNISLNAVLIPKYGGYGAAMATMLTEVAVLIPAIYLLRGLIGYRFNFRLFTKVVISAAFSVMLIQQFDLWGSLWAGLCILPVYGLAAFLTRAVRPKQIRTLLSSIRSRP